MIDLFQVYEELAPSLGEASARILTKTLSRIYDDVRQMATKTEFRELTAVVGQLADAQKGLAEAQKRTEERLDSLALRMEELAEAQKRTEERLDSLALRVEELAEAQKRTEARLDSLALRVEELAEAQKRTEDAIFMLTKRVDRLEERVEGISHSVGYSLENSAYKALPALLAARGIEVQGRLVRRYLGEYQVNIFGQGVHAGAPVTILGECKVRPSRKEVDRFLKVIARLEAEGLVSAPRVLLVGHDFHPTVERYLEEKGVLWFWSYEL